MKKTKIHESGLNIIQNPDGSFAFEWDPKDERWSWMNGLTDDEVKCIIECHLKIVKMPVEYQKYGSDQNLLDLIEELQEKYQGALEDIKRLEEENIENTNLIYELMENVGTGLLVLTSCRTLYYESILFG
jgi:hypothetical protein